MSWYYGTHSCGHESRTNIVGPTKNRQWIADRHFEKLCPECWEKQLIAEREKANAEAAEKAKEMELPELTGSEKQVAWANTLRQKMLDYLDSITENTFLERSYAKLNIPQIMQYIISQTKASWFIDTRDLSLGILLEIMEKIKKEEANKAIDTQEKDIKAESTVIPENAVIAVPAEIKIIDNNVVRVYFEKNDTFMEIVKKLDYEWGTGYWFRKIKNTNGPASDRAAELGNKLLNAGIPITITDNIILQNAITGNYEPEYAKWIMKRTSGDYAGMFAIWWKDKDDKLYRRARSLPGSRWSKPDVIVRIEHYKEVLEFGELYGFKVSNAALEAIEEYKKSIKSIKVINPAQVAETKTVDGLKEILKSSDEILDDLKEED